MISWQKRVVGFDSGLRHVLEVLRSGVRRVCTALIRVLWRGGRAASFLMLRVQAAAAGPHLEMQQTPRGVVVMWERRRQDEFSISTLCEELRSLYSVSEKVIQGGQGQRCWAMLLCLFIYKCRGKSILFSSACLSHSVQLEFSVSVQTDCAAPLSLCEPQAG